MDDRLKFRERLQVCADKAGSIYALAKIAGLPANTLRRYLVNSEPTRPKLVAIAQAAGVSVQWLATGEGQSMEQVLPPGNIGNLLWIDGLADRLKALVEKDDGIECYCYTHGFDQRLLEDFLKTGWATASFMQMLARNHLVPIRWLIAGSVDPSIGFRDTLGMRYKEHLFRVIDDIDDYRLIDGILGSDQLKKIAAYCHGERHAVFDLFARIYQRLPPNRYKLIQLTSNRTTDYADTGDLIVIDEGDREQKKGLYAFRDAVEPEADLRIIRLTEIDGKIRVMPIGGRPYLLSEIKGECIGRIALIVRDFKDVF